MKKTLITYYSKTGSNRYLAERFAERLNADVEKIRPRAGAHGLQVMFSLLGFNFGTQPFEHPIENYDRLVVIGPIWMGQLIAPLKAVIQKYRNRVPEIVFATCCGSTDAMKDDKFGYGKVFEKARKAGEPVLQHCVAFPVPLLLPKDQREDDQRIMETRMNDENFQGEALERFEKFMETLQVDHEKPLEFVGV